MAHGGIAASTAQVMLEGMGRWWGRRGLGTGRPLVVLDDGVLAGQGPLRRRAWGSTREVVELWGGLLSSGSSSGRGSQQIELSWEVSGRWRWVWGAGAVRRGLGWAKASGPQDTTPRQALKA